MSRFCISIFCFLTSVAAFGADIKVTSFRFLESGAHFSPGAEFCGELVAPTGKAELIKVTSDPDSKGPGIYYTWAGKDGKFCLILATYTGQANAEINQ